MIATVVMMMKMVTMPVSCMPIIGAVPMIIIVIMLIVVVIAVGGANGPDGGDFGCA